MRNILLSSLLFFLFPCFGSGQEENRPECMDALVKTVGSTAFRELAEAGNGIILDVRTPEEVAAGYIEGAVNMDVRDENFRELIKALPKDKDIYVYCRTGKRSLTAAGILCESGFKHIYNLKDGITGWVNDNYELRITNYEM